MNKMKNKLIVAATSLASAIPVLAAEGDNPLSTVETKMTSYITAAGSSIVTILTAGAVIVGSFYLWRVLKRALSASK